MLLLLPTGLASSLPWPGLASVARGGSNCQNSMLLAPHRRARWEGPNSPAFFVLTGSTQSPCPHRELLGTKSMATPYLSHWALWPGTLHLVCWYSFDSTGVSCPDAYAMALSATIPGEAWTGQTWDTAGSLCPLWCPSGPGLERGTSVPDSLLNGK